VVYIDGARSRKEEETTFNGLIPFNMPKLSKRALQAMDPDFVAQTMYSSGGLVTT